MPEFLLEIGCEEIPARMIDSARVDLASRISNLVAVNRLSQSAQVSAYSTPRRLAVIASGISLSQPDVEEELLGPSLKVAFKDGKPTAAAEAFAKRAGVIVSRLRTVTNPKGEYLSATTLKKGRSAVSIFAELLPKEIAAIAWPKTMYWRGRANERFIRPIRWIVALLDGEVMPFEFAGIASGSESRGHRIIAHEKIRIGRPNQYLQSLKEGAVLADSEERLHKIRKELDIATRAIGKARWREDSELLSTVTNLTEYPSVIAGKFDSGFLALPQEVLVTVMRDHQRYFAVDDDLGKLLPHFLAVLNTNGDPEGLIRQGHERVLRARLTDARFFWDIDQKTPLRQRIEMLQSVVFEKTLGSYYEKSERVAQLALMLADDLARHSAAPQALTLDKAALEEAAWLAKTDLTTELVKEFTELQGIIGGLYARAQGLDSSVANAIYDHYKPGAMQDDAPATLEGALLSIADKADSIAGMFSLGLQPTGSKDPFSLRRQANGIVKTLAQHKLPISIDKLFQDAQTAYLNQNPGGSGSKFRTAEYLSNVKSFFRERIEFYLSETLNLRYDIVNAVMAAGQDDIPDLVARSQAISEMRTSEDFVAICASFKRIKNILRQAAEENKPAADVFNDEALMDDAEINLARKIAVTAQQVEKLRSQQNYRDTLIAVSKLRPAVDEFFDKVMVMVEDPVLRSQRLALLQKLLGDFSTIADFSEIVIPGSTLVK